MAPHSSTLAWKIPRTQEPGRLHGFHGVAEGRTRLSNFTFTFHFFCIGEGNGNPLQCSCLENPRDGVAWWAAVYGVAQSQTRLKRLSSSSSSSSKHIFITFTWQYQLREKSSDCRETSGNHEFLNNTPNYKDGVYIFLKISLTISNQEKTV